MFELGISRSTVVAVAVAATMALGMPGALAAPGNDDFDGARLIPGVPFSDALDTTEAATASDDPDCAGQGPTVWYTLTLPADALIRIDTFGSDYDTTLSVYTGSRGALTQIACNDDAGSLQSELGLRAVGGETYAIMVGAYGGGPGGRLHLSLVEHEPLTMTAAIDRSGTFSRTGEAVIRGTVTCDRQVGAVVSGALAQRVGRRIVRGSFEAVVECDDSTAWRVRVVDPTGTFAGGRAEAIVTGTACDPFSCITANASRTVRLDAPQRWRRD